MEQGDDAAPLLVRGPSPRRPSSHRPSRRRRAAWLLAGTMTAALVGLWVERRPIAGHFVDRALAQARVPARYTIADLGLGRQRLTGVVIGDPAHPDLVADRIDTEVGWSLAGPTLAGITAGHVRVRGRVVDGRLSFGALDRLSPASSGKPFALPALAVDVADARLRLDTPWGLIGVKLAGAGRLDGGFVGSIAAVAPQLRDRGCGVTGTTAAMRVRSLGRDGAGGQRVALDGPVRLAGGACGGARIAAVRADVTANLALGSSRESTVEARLATGAITHRLGRAGGAAGMLSLVDAGGGSATGRVDLSFRGVRGGEMLADAGAETLAVKGAVARGAAGLRYDGSVAVTGADLAALIPRFGEIGAGTPVAPLARTLGAALRTGAQRLAGEAELAVATGGTTRVTVRSARLRSASGIDARLAASAPQRAAIDWTPPRGLLLDARLAVAGGSIPSIRLRATRPSLDGAIRGTATVEPYAAGDARLVLAPVAFAAMPAGTARITTRATLSGPLGDGRVDDLALPLDLQWDGRGRWTIDPGCVPLAWRRLVVGGLLLDPATLALCPTGGALVEVAGGGITGGARAAAARLTGRLGGTPLRLATGGATVAIGSRGFAVADLAATLGTAGRESTLTIAALTGSLAGSPAGGLRGTFAGGGGRIANVPLVLSAAAGDWRLAGGALDLGGAMTVADAAAAPRFRPLAARGVTVRLADGRIAATGTLREPTTGAAVAEVRIAHALAAGTGFADLAVPGIVFAPGYQPDLLTPLTFGVVADVRGTVAGHGRIDWSPDRVASTGDVSTAALDLAAAFGPVTGIATSLHFTDLLGMKTAPGQVATVRTVNPGIPVTDGTVRYALAGPTLVQIEGARWPFAGGTLMLEPTLLDFSENRQRRMTFRVDGAAADQFLQQFDFGNLDATGIFDGVLPMVFDESGGRIENGHLQVRPGGGSLAYVGALGQQQLGLWGNLAFQALKSLRYRSLALTLSGPLTGEMVTDVRFAGISQGAGAKGNFIVRRLQRLPFVFNIRIKAPFRGLLDSAQSFYDPKRLIQRNLPALLDEQQTQQRPPPMQAPVQAPVQPPVQPPASETVR